MFRRIWSGAGPDATVGNKAILIGKRTFSPYGLGASSVDLTLWKSYLLSWRTKLAKFECLKCFGRIDVVNWFMSCARSSKSVTSARFMRGRGLLTWTTKEVPSIPQLMIALRFPSSKILCRSKKEVRRASSTGTKRGRERNLRVELPDKLAPVCLFRVAALRFLVVIVRPA